MYPYVKTGINPDVGAAEYGPELRSYGVWSYGATEVRDGVAEFRTKLWTYRRRVKDVASTYVLRPRFRTRRCLLFRRVKGSGWHGVRAGVSEYGVRSTIEDLENK